MYAVITGGGTAGHVLPALAIAEELEDRGHRADTLLYVGAQRGIETRLVPATPYPHVFLDVVGVQRRVARSNAAFVPKLFRAVAMARRLLQEHQPRVVISVGGYASLPAVLAARQLRTPVVVVSFDRRPGRASALAARFAAACAVSFEGSRLPRAVVTGPPVRREIRDVDRVAGRRAARATLGLPVDRFVLAVTGGSQGSGPLNEAILAYAAEHDGDAGLAIYHVAGERFAATVSGRTVGESGVIHRVVGYEPRIDLVYAAADLLVGRGGASTVAEVAVTGIPAILVPWAASAEDHQTANVRWLADQGGAVHLPEASLWRLDVAIDELRGDAGAAADLGRRAAAAGATHRRGAIAALVERVAVPEPATDDQ
ncbi:MAG: murG [Desertimonas sp.]|nr:murG [Desertimonas sp.]